jgi:hypothetical protein
VKTLVLVIVFSCVLGSAARADGFYNTIASGCKIDPRSAPVYIEGGSVTFEGAATGYIFLWCPITFTMSPPSWLEMLATDTGPGAYVQLLYEQADATNGSSTIISNLISTDNVDGYAHFYRTSIFATYAPTTNRYYVRVIIYRNSPSYTVKAYGISVY